MNDGLPGATVPLPEVSRPRPDELPFLERTLELARRGAGRVAPNPQVGCVLVRGGEVLAEGWHRRLGGDHAEIDAIGRLASPEQARGATAFVNLEPCSHQGRTGPCADRLIECGVARVVCCLPDPNPEVAGRGLRRLAEAGVQVAVGGPTREAIRLNLEFLVPRLLGRPAVSLKWASSLDGRIATRTGHSQWISSAEGREWALDLREWHDAILVGSETAVLDDPRLDRRRGVASGPIVRVVLDRRLRLSPDAAMFQRPGQILIYTSSAGAGLEEVSNREERVSRLRRAGAEVVELAEVGPDDVLADLAGRGLNSLLVEGGGEVLESFRAATSYDRVLVCLAPRLIGGREASPAIGGLGAATLEAAAQLEDVVIERRGPDLIVQATQAGRLDQLAVRLGGLIGRASL